MLLIETLTSNNFLHYITKKKSSSVGIIKILWCQQCAILQPCCHLLLLMQFDVTASGFVAQRYTQNTHWSGCKRRAAVTLCMSMCDSGCLSWCDISLKFRSVKINWNVKVFQVSEDAPVLNTVLKSLKVTTCLNFLAHDEAWQGWSGWHSDA